jgi:hypothetical protein
MKIESLEGMEITPAAPRRSFPLQSSISQASVTCFYVLAALLLATRKGNLFIGGFRSRRIQQDEDRRHRSNKGERVGPTGAGNLAVWAVPVWPSWLPCCISFASKSCSVEKLVPPKFLVIWTPFGSLKVKNIEKEVFWFSQVNPIKLGNI